MPRCFLCIFTINNTSWAEEQSCLLILGVTMLLHASLGDSPLLACDMPKVKPSAGIWTWALDFPCLHSQIFQREPLFWAARFLMVSSAWVPLFYGFRVTGRLLYHKVLPCDGTNKTAWLLSLLLNTSAWPGFAHTFLEQQTSGCHGGHQCAFLLTAGCADLSSCLPTPRVMEKAGCYLKTSSLSSLTTHPFPFKHPHDLSYLCLPTAGTGVTSLSFLLSDGRGEAQASRI